MVLFFLKKEYITFHLPLGQVLCLTQVFPCYINASSFLCDQVLDFVLPYTWSTMCTGSKKT